jgi:hypothetical protein
MDEATAALFPDAFDESELGLVPRGWGVAALDSVADFLNGLALQKFPPENDDDWLPVIKIAQLRKGDTSGADHASQNIKSEYIVQNGDVLFSWSGSLEVEVWCGGMGALNQHLFKVTSKNFAKWFYFLWTRYHLPHFQQIAAGKATTMGHIQRKHLTEAKVLVPPESLLGVMTEDQLEQEALGWLAEVGYTPLYGPDWRRTASSPERSQLPAGAAESSACAGHRALNPQIPDGRARGRAQAGARPGHPGAAVGQPAVSPAAGRRRAGAVPADGETRGDFVRLIDWADPARNEWLAINQFSIKGPHHTRRPDIILFVNGLPLVLLELKNPADVNADIWKAFDQIQTYKAQIPDVFQYNEMLVISDGSEARMGSLSANAERFMQWRTIDGVTLDPLGEFNELETLVRGVLAPADAARLPALLRAVRGRRRAGQEDRRLPPVPRGARGDPAGGGGLAPRRQPARAAWCGTPRAAARASP